MLTMLVNIDSISTMASDANEHPLRHRTGWIVAAALALLLIASNGWWALESMDTANSAQYRQQVLLEECEGLDQTMDMLPLVATGRSKMEILSIAHASAPESEPFDKDGYVWIGRLGFKFERDALIHVRRSVSPPPDCSRRGR